MKDFFKDLLSHDSWLIKQEGWDQRNQGVRETQFTLGNGYLGSRGVLEELPYDAYPGTYVAGVYDKIGAMVTELVNLPNPISFKIIARGEKFGMVAMDALKHERILDMKKGLLTRKTLFLNAKKERFSYQSLRFFSMHNPHIGVMQICITPLDNAMDFVVESTIDTAVTNKGVLTEGRKRHFELTKYTNLKNINYIAVETHEGRTHVGYASYLKVVRGGRSFSTHKKILHFDIKKGESVCFTKIFSIYTCRDVKEKTLERECVRSLRTAVGSGFHNLLNQHIRAWQKEWMIADVKIDPTTDVQKALRFNIYHMLIAGNKRDARVSIPARTLSGEGYRGHVFWDTEIFIFPFFVYTNPVVARNMLYYRYYTLGAARKNAKREGLKGALFSWESADTGEEVTPTWHKDLDGRVIRIHTGEMECHIVGDVAYATYQYYLATGDEDFMKKAGLELIFESARFWASRVEYSRIKRTYHIKHVIGPDEFHINVKDNAYTNAIAKWNLMVASRLYKENSLTMQYQFKKLIKKIKLEKREAYKWQDISEGLVILQNRKGDLIESFEGYFKKKDVMIKALDKNFMPLLPKDILLKDIKDTQYVKQADVVMLLHLFGESYSLEQKRENFSYYNRRTLHKSSLSSSIYAAVGWETGNFEKAYRYFLHSLYADLKNYHGNTFDGIHAASLGGSWQVVIYGFAGMKLTKGGLSFNPVLPEGVKLIKFKIRYKDYNIIVCARKNSIGILPLSKHKRLRLRIYGEMREVLTNKRALFKKLQGR